MPSWKKVVVSGSDAAIPSVSTTADFTIDAGGDIVLDADGTDIILKDGGTSFGSFKRASSDLIIKAETADKDIVFKGTDGSSTIEAMRIDISEAGTIMVPTAIGVGTSGMTVDEELHVEKSQNTLTRVKIENTNAGSSAQVQTNYTTDKGEFNVGMTSDAHSLDGAAILWNTANSGMYFATNNTQAMLIDASQDIKIEESVGIGVAASSTTGRLDCSNDVIAFSSSDKRWKENIIRIENPLDKISKIGGYTFDWKELTEEEKRTQHANSGHDVGVIAQEIQEVLPEVVKERDNGYLAVDYEKIVPLLIESIKELQKKVEDIEKNCDCLNK